MTDGSHLSRAGRVVMALAVVLLLLVCSGNNSRRLDSRLLALRQRAPPSWRL